MDRRAFLGGATSAMAVSSAGEARSEPAGGDESPRTLAYRCDVPVAGAWDVVVCGGGPAGVAAALSARRGGAKVLLVEGEGQLGGTGTSGLVSHWLGGRTSDCKRWVVGGVFRSLVEAAAKRGAALIPTPDPKRAYQPHGWYKGQLAAGIPFDPYGMAALLDETLRAAKVDVLLGTRAVDVRREGSRLTHAILHNKSHFSAVAARAFVDATGDADLAARSGCPTVKGRPEDGLLTPASLTFHVDHVDQAALDATIHKHKCPRFRKKIAALREAGEWPFAYTIFISVQLDEPGTMMINTTRLVGVDGCDGASRSEAMARGRAEIGQLLAILRKHFPGFAKARLKAVAPTLGVRETRRIVGPYVLTVADLNRGRDFDDTIGFSAYGWDLPNPKRPSDNPHHGRKRPVTPIPYRILLPQKVDNLICPGRAVSVERPVLGPLRVMAPCMAMGQAAGHAAALAAANGTSFAEVDTKALRAALAKAGAIVDWT